MQHSESRPSFEVLPHLAKAQDPHRALWVALAIGIVGLLLALTYALGQLISRSWLFVC